jgi:hypothetical protein
MDAPVVPSLVSLLGQIPDPRKRRGRRSPWTALRLVPLVALLRGANSQRAIARWGQHLDRRYLQLLGFPCRRGPSLATLHRLFRQVPVADLEDGLGQGLTGVRAAGRRAGRRSLSTARRCAGRGAWGPPMRTG